MLQYLQAAELTEAGKDGLRELEIDLGKPFPINFRHRGFDKLSEIVPAFKPGMRVPVHATLRFDLLEIDTSFSFLNTVKSLNRVYLHDEQPIMKFMSQVKVPVTSVIIEYAGTISPNGHITDLLQQSLNNGAMAKSDILALQQQLIDMGCSDTVTEL